MGRRAAQQNFAWHTASLFLNVAIDVNVGVGRNGAILEGSANLKRPVAKFGCGDGTSASFK